MLRQACSHRSLVRSLAVLWALALAAVFLAGCSDPGAPELLIRDERGQLDTLRVDAAAAPLLARGADVAVIIVERGDDRGEDLSRRLAAEGMRAGDDIVPPLLAIYISYSPRYTELRAGSQWSALLPAATLRAIREGQLNPALRSGDPDDGVAATLSALEAAIIVELPRQRIFGWSVLIICFAVAGALLLARPVAHQWWRLREALPTSPLGRFWATTPFGRRQVRRRFRQELAAALEHLATGTERALERYAHAAIVDETLEARRAALEAQRADLTRRAGVAQEPSDDPDLLAALWALPPSYESLVRDAERLAAGVASARRNAESAALRAAELVRRVGKSFEPKPGATVGDPIAYRQLADLRATLGALDGRRAALGQAPATAALRTARDSLAGEYALLETALLDLWRSAFPKAHAGYVKQKRRSGSRPSEASSAGYVTASSASSSSDSSNSSDSSGDYGSSSSSSDGGSW